MYSALIILECLSKLTSNQRLCQSMIVRDMFFDVSGHSGLECNEVADKQDRLGSAPCDPEPVVCELISHNVMETKIRTPKNNTGYYY